MLHRKVSPFFLCFILNACSMQASPEDAQMANALCAQGKTLLAIGKNSDARDVYASATNRDDENPRAWNGLGVANDLLGKKSDAQDAYQRAVDLAPNDLAAVNNLAHADLAMGDADTAVTLLQPYANDPGAPPALKQNLEAALKAVQTKQTAASDVFADLGSYPTDGMAQGHVKEAKAILGSDARDLSFAVEPEVKTIGGVPSFTIKVTGAPPQSICDELISRAFPCIPQGK